MQKKQSAIKNSHWAPWLEKALQTLKPPEKMLMSAWAEKHRVLDAKSSAIPGPWRNNVTPYLVGIMNEFNNPETEEIVFLKPTQVGGTEVLQNALGYFTMQDPQPAMVVYPSQDLAKHVSKNRLRPMFRVSKGLSTVFFEDKSEELELQFDGMFITLEGANSPASLSSKPVCYLLLDEVDKYPGASKKEADPIKLARERTKTFSNRKIFMASTPTVRTGHIWKAKENADVVKMYKVPCPHCNEYIDLKMSRLKWPSREDVPDDADRAEGAFYSCQCCGMQITDRHKPQMLREGRWEVSSQRTKFPRKICFWMNTLYSPFVRFSEVAKEFLTSKDDPEAFQNFVNSWLAEPWEDTKLKTNSDMVLERQTKLEEFVVPEWTEFLTGGVDVQETSLYWVIRAWGPHLTSQVIAKGQALNFAEVERIMNMEFKKPNGEQYQVNLAGVDSGDQTDLVYEFCSRNSEWAIPVKGIGGGHSYFKITNINRVGSGVHGMRLLLVDGGKYKDMIASRMRKANGKGSWMVHKDCGMDYAEQVTAEHKITVKSGGTTKDVWVPKTSHADNHYLDCEVYALAVADVLGVRSLSLLEEQEQEAQPPREQQINDNAISQNDSWLGTNKSGWV